MKNRTHATKPDHRAAAIVFGLGLCGATLAFAEEPADAAAPAATPTDAAGPATAEAPAPVSDDPVVQDLFDAVKWLQLEHERNAYISDAIKAADADGVRRLYQGNAPIEITRRGIVMDGLQNNLRAKQGPLGVNVADAVLEEASAVFEPVFNVALTHFDSSTFNRVEHLTKFKKATEVIAGQNRQVFEEGVVEYLAFDLPRPAGIYPTTEIASESNIFGSDNRRVFNLSMQQALPWGADLAISYQMQFHNTYYQNNAGARRAGLTTYGNYYRPWTGSLSAGVVLPLPYTRNFGPNSAREVTIKIAGIERARADDRARNLVNDTLLQVDSAYFELVRSALQLDITLANKHQVEDVAKRTDKLLRMELITQLNKSEVDTELARINGLLEVAWSGYVQASNRLNALTNQDTRRLLLPVGYAEKLTGKIAFDESDDALKDAVRHPLYAAGDKPSVLGGDTQLPLVQFLPGTRQVETAEVSAAASVVNARPDVKVDFTTSYSQLDSTFGYPALDEALGSTFDPDARSYNMGISLIRPWGNRAPRAALRSAELELSARNTLVKQTLNELNRDLDNALVDHASARARVDITQRNVELKRAAYDRALRAQAGRTVSEFELITQSRELLDANTSWINALIDARKQEIAVLAAAGLLPDRFGELTALSMLDESRLVGLNEKRALRYFGGEVR